MDIVKPTNVFGLINETLVEYNKNGTESYANSLISIIKKHHLWPSMQVKKFADDNNIVLLHNSYKLDDIGGDFKELYEQCRSIILDFSLEQNNIVVSYANNIPIRTNIDEYAKIVNETDRYYEAYDGTMITVYNYNGKWHFGTTSCTDMNASKFNHPTKSHGVMFDEVLRTYFVSQLTEEEQMSVEITDDLSSKLRCMFTGHLNPCYAYDFVLVHYDNRHFVDYTTDCGTGYMFLIHANTQHRVDLCEIDDQGQSLAHMGVRYPNRFASLSDAFNYISAKPNNYGFIVKKIQDDNTTKLYKISPKNIEFREDTDPCKPNLWHNLLVVYMKNRKEFVIKDYISHYATDIELPLDNKGNPIDPTYLIHTMISTLKDVLYTLYVATTTYNTKSGMFKMNKELDKKYPPIIRFHLAQLRYRQSTAHKNSFLKQKDVYYYLCHCNNIKNIRLLVTFLSTNSGYDISDRASYCLSVLDTLL